MNVDTTPSWQALFEQGTQFLQQAQDEQAMACFEQVCQQAPEFPGGHYNLGLCLFRLGRLEAASSAFQTAIKLAPPQPEIFLSAAKCALAQENCEEAIELFGKVLALKSDSDQALLGRGLALSQLGQVEQAANDFKQVPGGSSNYWMTQHYLGCCLIEMEQSAAAVEALNRSEKASPGRSETREMLFMALHQDQQYHEALELFEELAEADPATRIRYSEEVRLARKATRIPVSSA